MGAVLSSGSWCCYLAPSAAETAGLRDQPDLGRALNIPMLWQNAEAQMKLLLLVPEEHVSTSTSNKVVEKHGFFPLCQHSACEGHGHPPLSAVFTVASLSGVWLAIAGSNTIGLADSSSAPVVTAAPKPLANALCHQQSFPSRDL